MTPLELTLPTDTQIRVRRAFAASRAFVWRAFSEPDLVKRWLTGPPGHTMPECEIDFREGGRWRYLWAMPEGTMGASGVFESIVPLSRIVNTESFDFAPDSTSLVETDFADAAAGTLVTMTMHYDSKATRDLVTQSGMDQGLEASFRNLDALAPAAAASAGTTAAP